MDKKAGVWAFVEQFEGTAHPVSYELIGKAKELAADLGVETSAVVLGHNVSHLAQEVISYGADNVYLVDSEILKDYRNEPYYKTLSELVKEHSPQILLLGATIQGRDLAAAVATEMKSGLTADCTGLDIDPETKKLLQTRPAYGGNIMATIWCPKSEATQMATVRPRVMPIPEPDNKRKGKIITKECALKEEDINLKVIDFIPTKSTDDEADLAYADVIVTAGRGVANPKNLDKVKELAKLINAHLGGSRGAVDIGLMDHKDQVGQTGKTVRPKVYMTLGVSGAIQHLVGMQFSDYIISVNIDKNAPIFGLADLGIVADLNDIVLPLIEEIKKRKNKNA